MSKLGKERTYWELIKLLSWIIRQECYNAHLSHFKEQKKGEMETIHFWEFFFRERNFSLKYRAIRPSATCGTRREAALRGAAYAWVPDF